MDNFKLKKIPWKMKSFLFRVIDIFHADKALYITQKYLTRRSKEALRSKCEGGTSIKL